MVWIGCLRCEKFRCHFVARPSAIIAPVRPDLHWVSCSNEMFPNASKLYETLQNMSLGSNGMDRVPLLWKIPTRLQCMNFCLFALVGTDLHQVLCSNQMVQMHPNHYETHKNMSLRSNGMDRVPSLQKIPTRLHCTNLSINCTSSVRFALSFTQ